MSKKQHAARGEKVIIRKKAIKDKTERKLFPLEGTILEIEKKGAFVRTQKGFFQCKLKAIKKAKEKQPKTLAQARNAFFETNTLGRVLAKNSTEPMETNRLHAAFDAGWNAHMCKNPKKKP